MNNFFEQFKKEGQNIRLSVAEKAAMKRAILGTPSTVPTPQTSPYAPFSFSLSIHFRTVMASLLIFVLVGSSTAYAAEGALPGQPLYAVKINVNENVEAALAVTPVQKAQVHSKLAQRRVEEAEALAASGELDAQKTAALAANFDVHAQAAASSTAVLAENDPAAAADVKADFDSSIHAHSEILAVLGDTSSSTEVRKNSGVIARAALALATRRGSGGQEDNAHMNTLAAKTAVVVGTPAPQAVTMAMTMTISDTATNTPDHEAVAPQVANKSRGASEVSTYASTGEEKVAASIEARATATIATVQKQYASLKSTLSASTIARIDTRLASTSALMSAGSSALGAGNYKEAKKDFTNAYRLAAELSVYLEAQKKYQKEDILPDLLKNSDDRKSNETKVESSGEVRAEVSIPAIKTIGL